MSKHIICFLSLLIFILNVLYTQAQPTRNSIKNTYYTRYFDLKKLQFIEEKYKDGQAFSNGFAGVKKDTLWGFIDEKGTLVIDYKYDEVAAFIGNYAAVKKGKLWTVINKLGVPCFLPTYKYIVAIKIKDKTYFIVQNNKDFLGLIDAKGNIVLDIKYTLILPLLTKKGLLLNAYKTNTEFNPVSIMQNNYEPYKISDLPKTNVEVYNNSLKKIVTLSNKEERFTLFRFHPEWLNKKNDLSDMFPASDKEIIKKEDDYSFNEKLYNTLLSFVYKDANGKEGIREGENTIIIPAQFDQIIPSIAFVNKVGKNQIPFITKNYRANKVTGLEGDFYIYYYLVEKNGQQGIYSLDGKEIIPPIFESIDIAISAAFVVNKSFKATGLYSLDGTLILEPSETYSSFGELNNNRMIVNQAITNKDGDYQLSEALATAKGKFLTPFKKYQSIYPIYNHKRQVISKYLVHVTHNDLMLIGMIDRDGKELVPPKYKHISVYLKQGMAVLQDKKDKTLIYFYDFKKRKIVKKIKTPNYSVFLIGSDKNNMLKILSKKEVEK